MFSVRPPYGRLPISGGRRGCGVQGRRVWQGSGGHLGTGSQRGGHPGLAPEAGGKAKDEEDKVITYG